MNSAAPVELRRTGDGSKDRVSTFGHMSNIKLRREIDDEISWYLHGINTWICPIRILTIQRVCSFVRRSPGYCGPTSRSRKGEMIRRMWFKRRRASLTQHLEQIPTPSWSMSKVGKEDGVVCRLFLGRSPYRQRWSKVRAGFAGASRCACFRYQRLSVATWHMITLFSSRRADMMLRASPRSRYTDTQ